MSWIEHADGTAEQPPDPSDDSGMTYALDDTEPEYLPPWAYMLGGPRPFDQDDPEPHTRPPLDPEEHAGRELTPEERDRRAALLARNREANQRPHRRRG